MREAIVTLGDEELESPGFDGLVSLLREAGIRSVEMIEDHGSTCIPQVEVQERLDGDALNLGERVDGWELVDRRRARTGISSNSPRRVSPTRRATTTRP